MKRHHNYASVTLLVALGLGVSACVGTGDAPANEGEKVGEADQALSCSMSPSTADVTINNTCQHTFNSGNPTYDKCNNTYVAYQNTNATQTFSAVPTALAQQTQAGCPLVWSYLSLYDLSGTLVGETTYRGVWNGSSCQMVPQNGAPYSRTLSGGYIQAGAWWSAYGNGGSLPVSIVAGATSSCQCHPYWSSPDYTVTDAANTYYGYHSTVYASTRHPYGCEGMTIGYDPSRLGSTLVSAVAAASSMPNPNSASLCSTMKSYMALYDTNGVYLDESSSHGVWDGSVCRMTVDPDYASLVQVPNGGFIASRAWGGPYGTSIPMDVYVQGDYPK